MTSLDSPLHPSKFETPAIWTQVADAYTELLLPFFQRCAEHALDLLDLDATMLALDLGCGPGSMSLPLCERVRSVDAVDFSSRMLECLRRRANGYEASRLRIHQMDGHQLGFQDDHFDVAVSMFGVVHFADPERGLAEMYRVIRRGGFVVASTWAAPAESAMNQLGAGALRAAFGDLPPDPEIFHDTRSPGEWEAMLERVGFDSVRTECLESSASLPSPEAYWSNMSRASVPLVLLKNSVSTDEWARVTQVALRHLHAQLPWPHPVVSKAYFFVARKPS